MDIITKKVSYLKGLAEGYGLDAEKDHVHNLLLGMLDCMELMAEEINFLDSDFQRLEEYVEMVDDDLSEIEMALDDDFCEDCDEDMFDEDWKDDEGWDDLSYDDEENED